MVSYPAHEIIATQLAREEVSFPRTTATSIISALRRAGFRIVGDEMGETPLAQFTRQVDVVENAVENALDDDAPHGIGLDGLCEDCDGVKGTDDDEDDVVLELDAMSECFQTVGYIIGTAQAAIERGIATAYAEAALADLEES